VKRCRQSELRAFAEWLRDPCPVSHQASDHETRVLGYECALNDLSFESQNLEPSRSESLL